MPFYSWYKEVDPNNPSALIPLTEKTFKYKFEATIPEPDVCTDCILARITVINVIAGDYGTYVLRATSEQSDFKDDMSESKVRLYRKISILIDFFYDYFDFLITVFLFHLQKLPSASSLLRIPITRVVVVRRRNSHRFKVECCRVLSYIIMLLTRILNLSNLSVRDIFEFFAFRFVFSCFFQKHL